MWGLKCHGRAGEGTCACVCHEEIYSKLQVYINVEFASPFTFAITQISVFGAARFAVFIRHHRFGFACIAHCVTFIIVRNIPLKPRSRQPLLSLDVGTRNVGVAMTDETMTRVFPYTVLTRRRPGSC